MVTEMVATERVEGSTSRNEVAGKVHSLGGSSKSKKVENKPISISDWKRYTPEQQLMWLNSNIQMQNQHPDTLLTQIQEAQKPKVALHNRFGGPGPKKQHLWRD